jgi:hypothetical protein
MSDAWRITFCSFTLLIALSLPSSGASGFRFELLMSATSFSYSPFDAFGPVTYSSKRFDLSKGLKRSNFGRRDDVVPGGRSMYT